jgi:hypothetical protein
LAQIRGWTWDGCRAFRGCEALKCEPDVSLAGFELQRAPRLKLARPMFIFAMPATLPDDLLESALRGEPDWIFSH